MPLLAAFGGIPWKLIGIAAGALAVIGAIFLILHQAKEIGALESERAQAIGVANANAAIAERAHKATKAVLAIAEQRSLELDKIRKNANVRRQQIIDAPASDDGPLAPVLSRVLDGLRPSSGAAGTGAGTTAPN